METKTILELTCSERIRKLKEEMLKEPRFASIEQARREHDDTMNRITYGWSRRALEAADAPLELTDGEVKS